MKILSLRRILAFAAACLLFGPLSIFADNTPPLFRYRAPSIAATVPAVYPIDNVASGTMILEIGLGKDGSIDDIQVIHGIPSLTSEAIAAVRKWKFTAARLNGQAIRSRIPAGIHVCPAERWAAIVAPSFLKQSCPNKSLTGCRHSPYKYAEE